MEEYIKRKDVIKVLEIACEKCMWNLNGHDDDEFPVCKTCYVIYTMDEVNAIPSEDVVSKSEYENCRNELCYKCGEYKNRHLGACDGCRWRDGG